MAYLDENGLAYFKGKLDNEISDLNQQLNLNQYDYFFLDSSMLEKGFYDNSGVKQNHSTRWRTKELIPVNAGDVLHGNRLVNTSSFIPYFKIDIFDASKAHTSVLTWVPYDSYVSGYTFSADGFIALSMQVGQSATLATDYDHYISIARLTVNAEQHRRATDIFGVFKEGPIGLDYLSFGYWSGSDAGILIHDTASRACVCVPIPVHAGDEIHPTNKTVLFDAGQKTNKKFRGYANTPFRATVDGNVYINFKNADNSAVTLSAFADSVRLVRNNHSVLETIRADSLINGYVDGSTHAINYAAHRVVGFDGIYCKKGDHVRVNLDYIAVMFFEFSETDSFITRASVYYSNSTIVYGTIHIGDYIVQNDCYIKGQMYKISDASAPMNPADYDGAYSVIHMADGIKKLSNGKYRFPRSPKKPRIIGQNLYSEMQDGTVINGKLWMDMDDYNGNHWFAIINLATGAIEKTIPHTLGHGNSIDYNANNDILLFANANSNTVYLLNHPTGDETFIAPADCIAIVFNSSDCVITSTCWGENDFTIYNAVGYDGTQMLNLCHKIILTVSNGDYTGAYTIQKTYQMDIRVGIDTVLGGNEVNYTQGMAYDGYIYLGYGTRRMNYLILDLDDDTGTANVVGNFYYPVYVNGAEQIMEPELFALNGSRMILGSREWNDKRSFLAEFDR